MKRLLVLILVWTLLVITGTLVSANGTPLKRSDDGISNQLAVANFTEGLNTTEAK